MTDESDPTTSPTLGRGFPSRVTRPAVPGASAFRTPSPVHPDVAAAQEALLDVPVAPPAGLDQPVLIEGRFTSDVVPDLFRFLCARTGRYCWRLNTLAGTFTLYFDGGLPLDVMFSPTRPVGAKVGERALTILFQQIGGQFQIWKDPPVQPRRSLHKTGEKLLIELATLADESLAPRQVVNQDLTSEMALVRNVTRTHFTSFRTSSRDVPLTELLQLFSASAQAYWVTLSRPSGERIGRLLLTARQDVGLAECQDLTGGPAFTALLTFPGVLSEEVTALTEQEQAGSEKAGTVLGSLGGLLMREVMSGRLSAEQLAGGGQDLTERPQAGSMSSGAPATGTGTAEGGRGLFGRFRRRG